MPFSVGDRVFIRPDIDQSVHEDVSPAMQSYGGMDTTIAKVISPRSYKLENDTRWTYNDSLLIPYREGIEWQICSRCSKKYMEGVVTVHGRNGTTSQLCPRCVNEVTATQCTYCGNYYLPISALIAVVHRFDDAGLPVASYVCHDCLETHHIHACQSCGRNTENDVQIGHDTYCPYCVRQEHVQCSIGHEWMRENEMLHVAGTGEHICNCHAVEHGYVACEECRNVFDPASTTIDSNGLCNSCATAVEEYYKRINGYHHGPRLRFHGEGKVFYGMELEVDDGPGDNATRHAVEAINIMQRHVYVCRDGSLRSGFEIITHPHTYEEMVKLPWAEMTKKLLSRGWRGHTTCTAGLHIHISREAFKSADAIDRFILFFENNWDFILKFSRRSQNELSRWAQSYFSQRGSTDCAFVKKHKKKDVEESRQCSDRYRCVNLQKTATIEVRIFRSTLSANTLMASLEMIKLLVEKANSFTNTKAEDATPTEWLSNASENLRNYCAALRIPIQPEDALPDEVAVAKSSDYLI